MKKAFPSLCLVLLSSLCLGAAAQERQVSVTGTSEVTAEPDSAEVSLSVQSLRRESSAAKTDVDTRVNAFLETIQELGFDEDSVTAGNLHTSPRYEYRSGQQTFAGYQASRSLTVEVENLDMLNDLLDAALGDQIDSVNNIRYKVADSSAMEAKARELAIEDSKQQAAELAEAYGAELGPIRSISYRSQNTQPFFMDAPQMARMEAADASSSGRYLPDEITFSDRVEVVFDLIVNP